MNAPSSIRESRHRELILAGVFGLVMAVVFGGVLYHDFVPWDDDINIYGNPGIRGLSVENLVWMFTDTEYVRRYMPLGWLSLAVDYALNGLNPSGYHLGNLLLHSINAILVFLIIRRLLGLGADRGEAEWRERRHFLVAAVAALFWAIHPLRVEPVAWASGRLYCQAGCLVLVSLWAYLQFVTRPAGAAGRRGWYTVACLAYLGSLLTYPIGLAWLLVFVVVDWFPLRRFNAGWKGMWDSRARGVWLEKLPFVVSAGLVFAVTLWSRKHSTGMWDPPVTLEEFGVFPRVMQAFYVWACYLWRTCYPADLAPLYTALRSFDPLGAVFCLSAVLVAGVSVLLVLKRRRWPAALAVWICHLGLLVPMLGLTEHPHFAADRYTYLVGIGYAVLLAVGLDIVCAQRRRAGAGFCLAVLMVSACGVASVRQIGVWKNGDTLFVHIIKTLGDDPYRFDTWYRLGRYRFGVGEFAKAEEAFREVLALRPGHTRAKTELGDALAMQSRFDEAVVVYADVLEEFPQHRGTRFNLARALTELGRREEATVQFRILSEAYPEDAQLHLAEGRFHARFGEWDKAIDSHRRALELDPELEGALSLLGEAYLRSGRVEDALGCYREAVRREPDSPNALMELAWVIATVEGMESRRRLEAISLATRANELTGGGHAAVLDTLAAAYAAGARYDEAVLVARRALAVSGEGKQKEAIQARLEAYGAGRPYRESRGSVDEARDP